MCLCVFVRFFIHYYFLRTVNILGWTSHNENVLAVTKRFQALWIFDEREKRERDQNSARDTYYMHSHYHIIWKFPNLFFSRFFVNTQNTWQIPFNSQLLHIFAQHIYLVNISWKKPASKELAIEIIQKEDTKLIQAQKKTNKLKSTNSEEADYFQNVWNILKAIPNGKSKAEWIRISTRFRI